MKYAGYGSGERGSRVTLPPAASQWSHVYRPTQTQAGTLCLFTGVKTLFQPLLADLKGAISTWGKSSFHFLSAFFIDLGLHCFLINGLITHTDTDVCAPGSHLLSSNISGQHETTSRPPLPAALLITTNGSHFLFPLYSPACFGWPPLQRGADDSLSSSLTPDFASHICFSSKVNLSSPVLF